MNGLHAIENSTIPPLKLESTLADQTASGLRTLLPSMPAGFHVLGAEPMFNKTLTLLKSIFRFMLTSKSP